MCKGILWLSNENISQYLFIDVTVTTLTNYLWYSFYNPSESLKELERLILISDRVALEKSASSILDKRYEILNWKQ